MDSDKRKKYGDQEIGKRLAKLLKETAESQNDLVAALSDISGEKIDRSLISKWISGERAIDKVSQLLALCEHFNVSADYLLFGEGHAKSIDPDVTAAMKFTGLSEEALNFLSVVTRESYEHFQVIHDLPENRVVRKTYSIKPLIDDFICKGIEKITEELQNYSLIKIEAEKQIQDTKNYLQSPYSNPTALRWQIHWCKKIADDLRLQSLSFGDICKSVGESVFDTERIIDEYKEALIQLREKDKQSLTQNGGET